MTSSEIETLLLPACKMCLNQLRYRVHIVCHKNRILLFYIRVRHVANSLEKCLLHACWSVPIRKCLTVVNDI
jgi:hypothetical protein